MATIRFGAVLWPIDVGALTDEQVARATRAVVARFGEDMAGILDDAPECSPREALDRFAESYADAHGEVLEIA